MSPLGKKKKPFVGVPTPPGYVPGLSRGESSSWSFLVLISSYPDIGRGGLCAGPNSNGDARVWRCCVGCAQCWCVQSGELLVWLWPSRVTPVSRFASVSRVLLEKFQVAPCLVWLISPAVVAGVGVDSVGFSALVPVSTISDFSSPGVFFLGLLRQYSPCGQGAHVTCPFIPLLAAESGGQDFVPLREKATTSSLLSSWGHR